MAVLSLTRPTSETWLHYINMFGKELRAFRGPPTPMRLKLKVAFQYFFLLIHKNNSPSVKSGIDSKNFTVAMVTKMAAKIG